MTKPPELLPCPFCGGDATLRDYTSHSTAVFIGCETIGCFGHDQWDETEADAIAAWNNRATDPAVQALVEAGRPFADIGVPSNPEYQPTIRLDRDAILALRTALAAFDKT